MDRRHKSSRSHRCFRAAFAALLTLSLAAAAQDAQRPRKIAVFGSSVANGSGDDLDRGGYAGRLGELLALRGWDVVNVSKGGDNTIKIAPRFEADLLPQKAGYVVIGLSLANEGIYRGEGAEYRDGIYEQWRTGILALIERCRAAGMKVAVANCYAHGNFGPDPELYDYTRRMDVEISRWDVPSINVLGAIDDGKGVWMEGFAADGGHPNSGGHDEMFHAFVPSLFEAIEAGKPIPAKHEGTGYAHTDGGESVAAPLVFTPRDAVHSFAVSFWVRPKGDGVLAGFAGKAGELKRDGESGKVMAIVPAGDGLTGEVTFEKGKLAYQGLRADVPEGDAWHHVVVSHWCARGATELYLDGVLAGTVAERILPESFSLGGMAKSGQAARADVKEWAVYRSSLNPDEVAFLYEGNLFQSSLEIYAPLADGEFTVGSPVENRAQSMSLAVVNAQGIHAGK